LQDGLFPFSDLFQLFAKQSNNLVIVKVWNQQGSDANRRGKATTGNMKQRSRLSDVKDQINKRDN
jgi:hypothetical protein